MMIAPAGQQLGKPGTATSWRLQFGNGLGIRNRGPRSQIARQPAFGTAKSTSELLLGKITS
jgi:hypothetical protein